MHELEGRSLTDRSKRVRDPGVGVALRVQSIRGGTVLSGEGVQDVAIV